MNDTEKVEAIRAKMPSLHKQVFLNTGTNGPMPEMGYQTLAAANQESYENVRTFANFMSMMADYERTREIVARLLACETSEVIITHNTTEGMNTALMALNLKEGDEIVTAVTEHPGGLYPVYLQRQRSRVTIRQTNIGKAGVDPVEELRRVISPRTKAVVLSHVVWSTGMVLPMRELADLAHQFGALLICDAAQSCGMVPSRVYDMGVDIYALSGQKWLCGPDSTGALFVRKELIGQLQQSYVGYFSFKASDYDGNFIPGEGATRFSGPTLYFPAVKAWLATLDWLEKEVGWDWIYNRIASLGRYCYGKLADVPGVKIYTPAERMAGLIHFSLGNMAAPDVATKLGEKGIVVRYTPDPALVRVSTGFYNTEEEIDRLAEALKEIATAG